MREGCGLGQQSDVVLAMELDPEKQAVEWSSQKCCWWWLWRWQCHSGSLPGAEEGAVGQETQVRGNGQPRQRTH
jgi:hypothetical protein